MTRGNFGMKVKSKLDILNRILAVILVCVFVALILVVNLYRTESKIVESADGGAEENVITIDEFVAGTYGGKEFATMEDVVNYYVECYNHTKTLTASYNENGETKTYYKLVGEEYLDVENLLVEGQSNSMIDSLVPGIVGGLFTGNVIGLPPSDNRDPNLDKNDTYNFTTSMLTVDDVEACNVVDNGDGTITITIQPKGVLLSSKGADSQGRFFNSLGDISSTVESISVLSFSSGTINDNFVVDYNGGSGVIKIDVASGEIVEADYTMNVHIDVSHANVSVLKDKSASLDIVYKNHFPASDEYLLKTKNITKA